jgi:hypothetical protein
MSCNYSTIANFGPAAGMSAQNDPLSYCLVSGIESGFNHTLGGGGSLLGPESSQCQLFMAQYCAQNNDAACAYAFNDNNVIYPNTVAQCNGPNGSCSGPGLGNGLTKGQFLLGNVAAEKYLVSMSSNCVRVYEPFDPTVAFSPMVSKWIPSGNSCAGAGNCDSPNVCIPIYDVNAKTIDFDDIMNRVLAQPWVATQVLINIYNHRMRTRRLEELKNTKLGRFFATPYFQKLIGH